MQSPATALVIDAEWIDAFGAGELLPPSLASWRPLVLEGLLHFLNRLPERRRRAILAAQLALAPRAPPAVRLGALLRQCPTLHKLGQVVARQPHLDAALRSSLVALETMPPEGRIAPLAARLRRDIADTCGLTIGGTALAQGSVAVVLPFSWREDGRLREGVFKVLRPGVRQRLADELGLLPEVAGFLTHRAAELGLPALDFRDILDGVGRLLEQEIRLTAEQANLRAARCFHADDPLILIPEVLRWSVPWATAMERVHGEPLGQAELSAGRRTAIARTAMAALLAKPFWSIDDPAVFHGDLHGGNLFVTPDGRLAVLDWALTARVGKRQREAVVAAVVGGLTFDCAAICRALADLGTIPEGERSLAGQVERSLDSLVAKGRPAGFGWLLALLDSIALDGGIRFDPQLSVFRKTWLSLSGLLADVAGEALPDAVLASAALRSLAAESPARWWAAPQARGYATHLSNADLVEATTSACFAGARWWQRAWGQALATRRPRDDA